MWLQLVLLFKTLFAVLVTVNVLVVVQELVQRLVMLVKTICMKIPALPLVLQIPF